MMSLKKFIKSGAAILTAAALTAGITAMLPASLNESKLTRNVFTMHG